MRSTADSSDPDHRPLGSSVLVGYDGSERAADALELGRLLGLSADTRPTAVFVGAHVGAASKVLRPVRDAFEVSVLDARSAVAGLTTAAQVHDATVIVLGTSHRGLLTQTLLGSTAEQLVHARLGPVAIAPRGYDSRYANRVLSIVVAGFDGSPDSHQALEAAAEVVVANEGSLRVVAVGESHAAGAQHRLAAMVDAAVRRLAIACEVQVEPGDAARHLADAAGMDTDLLVIGSSSYTRFARFLFHGVPGAVHPGARCPVLIVPAALSPALPV
jgi:nucleotide-binding universal stress UspA family protein